MSFKLLLYAPDGHPEHSLFKWRDRLEMEIPGIEIDLVTSEDEAIEAISSADAAFGNISSEIFVSGERLRWVACPQAGPPSGWYHDDLVNSDVVVTNTREIYNDHISTHILAFMLAFARGLNNYLPHQLDREWHRPAYRVKHLPDSTVLIVGVGGIGGETARLCKSFGMKVLATDPRIEKKPVGVDELHHPNDIGQLIPRADFVVSTVPETPKTGGYFDHNFFDQMREGAFFINIGRGATVVLDDLDSALRSGHLAGAGLDVFEIEPLPEDHPLWKAPGILITPHVAGEGPYLPERRTELFIDNCKRFANGEKLINVVDKNNWF